MSRPIDEKIVAMKLDNSDLVKKASETTTIFGKLSNTLNRVPSANLSRTTRELSNIRTNVDRTDFTPMARSLDTIASRFSTLGVVATTALTNITNKAINAGMQLQHSLTTAQVFDGFREYEMKMGSIGTMLSNTEWAGTTLGDVKKTLAELNDYADQTIYSFAEMTSSIGRFTAAGVTLEDSTVAIKGLGNLAAVSGSNAHQLNIAMYQMSQAMAAGKLNLMDWNSMVNAGMGGKKTQDALIATAKAMGKNVDLSDGFRNSIQDGWLTSEVFLETLKKFGSDESMTQAATRVKTFTQMLSTLKEGIGSGWAETWELIFGDFEEATRLWTAVSNLVKKPFDRAAEARNDFLRAIIGSKTLDNMFYGIKDAAQPVIAIFKSLRYGFKDIFPSKSVAEVESISESFRGFSEGLTLSQSAIGALTIVFKGVFSIFSSVWEVTKLVVKALSNLTPIFTTITSGALALIAGVASIPIAFNESIKSGNLLTRAIERFGSALAFISKVFVSGTDHIVSFASSLKLVEGAADVLEWIGNAITYVSAAIVNGFAGASGLVNGVSTSFGNLNKEVEPVSNIFTNMFDSIGRGWQGFKDMISGIGDAIKSMGEGIANNPGWLLAGGGLTALIALGWRFWEMFSGFSNIVSGFGEAMEGVGDALGALTLNIHANSILKLALALAIMAVSLKVIADLGYERIGSGLYAVTGSLMALIGAMAVMSKYNIIGSMATAAALVGMSGAILLMSIAFRNLAGLDWAELTKGIYVIGAMLLTLGVAAGMMSIAKGKMSASVAQLIAIGVAIHIIVFAIEKIAKINPEKLRTGLQTISAILIQIGVFAMVLSLSKFDSRATLGLLAIAASLHIIVGAISKIASMDIDKLRTGLQAISAILVQLGVFAMVLSLSKFDAKIGLGVLLMAAALNALIIPIQILGVTPIEVLIRGLGALALALVAIGAASLLMKGTIGGAIAIGIMALALNAFIVPMVAMAQLSWDQIGKSLIATVGLIAAVGLTAVLLTPAIPIFAAFAVSLALLGLGMMAAGAAIPLFAKGLVLLTTMGAGAVTVIVGTIGSLITGLISLAPAFVDLLMKIGSGILTVIERMLPKIVDTIARIMLALWVKVGEYLPKFIDAGADIMVNFIDGMAIAIPRVIESAQNYMITLVTSMASAIRENGKEFNDAISELMAEVLIVIVDTGITMVNALFGWIPGVKEAGAYIGANVEAMIRENFDAGGAGDDKGSEFINAIAGKEGDAKSAGQGLGQAGKDGAESIKMNTSGINFGTGFASGINSQSVMSRVKSAAIGIAKAASNSLKSWLDIRSPSRHTHQLGDDTGTGFSNGISSTEKKTSGAAGSLAEKVMNWLGVKSPVITQSSKGGQKAAEGFSKGVGSSKSKARASSAGRSVGKSAADSAMDGFNEAMSNAQYKFDMGQINANQHLAEIKRIRDQYAKYPNLVRDANLKIKQLEEDIARQREEARKKEFDDFKKGISDKKYYNQLSLTDELKSWEKMMKNTKAGTEERKEAEREVYRLKNELNDKIISMNEEYADKMKETNQRLIDGERELNEEYERAVSDRARTLTGFAGLFDKVTMDSKTSGQELVNNLRDQVGTFQSWSNNIQALASRGIDNGLLEELRQMGPRSAAEVAALTHLTSIQLEEYSQLWRTKNNMARHQAEGELEGLKGDTASKIDELREQTETQLEAYRKEWADKISEIRKGTTDKFVGINEDMSNVGEDIISGLITGINGMGGPLVDEVKRIAESISGTIRETLQIKSPSRIAMKDGAWFGEGLIRGMADKVKGVGSTAKKLAITARDSLNSFVEGFEPEDNELRFKAVIDYDSFDPNRFGRPNPIRVSPDTSFTNGLVNATKYNLGQNGSKTPRESVVNSVENNNTYEIHVEYNGVISRAQIKKLAEDIQTEIKSIDDRARLSRGEEVAF